MDAATGNRDPLAGDGARPVATPHPDGPGNAAWQRTLALLEGVEAEEQARRRSNWRSN